MWLSADRFVRSVGVATVVASTVVVLGEPTRPADAAAASAFKQPTTLTELLGLSDAELDQVDVGLINILCAESLRGSENLNASKCLGT